MLVKTLHQFGLGNDGGETASRMVTINGDLYFVTGSDGIAELQTAGAAYS